MESITIHDKKFRLHISSGKIVAAVNALASQLNKDLEGSEVVFIGVLNGSFMFASDLMKKIRIACRISFVKLASYEGTENTGRLNRLIGINEVLTDKTVVIIEDIVDSGNTINTLIEHIGKLQPAEIKTVALLFKPDAYEYNHKIDYTGFRIPNTFVVGYGLDYDGLGRNLNAIYAVVE